MKKRIVTKFGCGGYSIGIGTSHSLFDGPATYNFLNAWASNSEIVKEKCENEVPKPVHERGILLLKSDNPQTSKGSINLASKSTLNVQQQARTIAIVHLHQLIMQAASGSKGFPIQIIGPSDQNKYVLKTYHISGAMIDYLKKKHFPMCKSGSLPFSTFEVLAAHLWKNGVNNDYVRTYIEALEGGANGSSLPPLKELTLVSDWTRIPFHNIEFFNGKAAYACPLATPVPQVAYFMQTPTHYGDDVHVRIAIQPQSLDAFTHCFFNNANVLSSI
ncbi:putative shikimate O-hydroxycinnamoyltransferase [Lupinus albus]|uniref:Putative shikimate O-hydroxycinnamoyltransferase n=1 Tax=Lupinus albus TaxID=3870 RepID=A0A6A4P0N3_LUPAL|nr:putative shikimate O-hydroxycinnamoyltransferase [Lupinus albus]